MAVLQVYGYFVYNKAASQHNEEKLWQAVKHVYYMHRLNNSNTEVMDLAQKKQGV